MVTRVLDLTSDILSLAAGLAAMAVGGLTFLVLAVLTLLTSTVSGTWLLLPCLVMITGLAAVTAWLVFGQGTQRFDPAPVAAQPWQWGPNEH